MQKKQLLADEDIQLKIKRMAYQILENNTEETLTLVGINTRGYRIAEMLNEHLITLGVKKVFLVNLNINPANPTEKISIDNALDNINEQVVILVDDVANTGRTLLYAMRPFFEFLPKKIQIAVLVDREHKKFPVFSDYIGITLSTTLRENIEVELENDRITGVFLE